MLVYVNIGGVVWSMEIQVNSRKKVAPGNVPLVGAVNATGLFVMNEINSRLFCLHVLLQKPRRVFRGYLQSLFSRVPVDKHQQSRGGGRYFRPFFVAGGRTDSSHFVAVHRQSLDIKKPSADRLKLLVSLSHAQHK